MILVIFIVIGLGGLGVTCSPRDPRFADSNPAEVDGFFQDSEQKSSGKNLKLENWTLSKI